MKQTKKVNNHGFFISKENDYYLFKLSKNYKCKNFKCLARKTSSRLKTFLLAIVVLLLCTFLLVFPESSKYGVKKGLIFSSEILIPSLFPFMFLSSFVVRSSLALKASKYLEKITRFLFNLPGHAGPTILLGLIGGYPTGARGINALLKRKEITLEQAQRMIYFVVGAGPAFVISVVGFGLMKNSVTGIILFASQVAAAILIGIILRFFNKDSLILNQKEKGLNRNIIDISSALVESCTDATFGMINMCSFVVLFSTLLNLINDCGIHKFFINSLINLGVQENVASSVGSMLLEVTSGCSNAARSKAPVELVSFGIGWAGICVHFQIISSLKDVPFSKIKFVFFRFLHGVIAAIFTHIGFILFPQTRVVINSVSQNLETAFSSRTEGSIALVILCACFLASISNDISDNIKA